MSNIIKYIKNALTGKDKTSTAVGKPQIKLPDVKFIEEKVISANIGFIIDATASRQHTWDTAREIQDKLFSDVDKEKNLSSRLVYYRGIKKPEDTGWRSNAGSIADMMQGVKCESGKTQIVDSLSLYTNDRKKANIVVLIGDCFEEEKEDAYEKAREMKKQGTRIFVFHENRSDLLGDSGTSAEEQRYIEQMQHAEKVFRTLAEITGGTFQRFDRKSSLEGLFGAAKSFALFGAEGLKKLAASGNQYALAMAKDMKLLNG